MKKQLFILTIALGAVVSSCQKAPTSEATVGAAKEIKIELDAKTNDPQQLRMDILKYPLEIQRALFNSLTPDQKAMVWNNKIEQAIAYGGWSEYQDKLLNELKDNISADLYNDSEKATVFRDQVQPEWLERAKGQFVFDDLMAIVSVLDDYTAKMIISTGGTSEKNDCTCSIKSDWCSTTLHQHCVSNNICTGNAHGCGTLWTYACKGLCAL